MNFALVKKKIMLYNIKYEQNMSCGRKKKGMVISMTEKNGKKILRVGTIGFGSMGKTHTYALKNLPFYYPTLPFEVELGGVCTRTQEKSDFVAKTFNFERAVTNENELINDPSIDIIDICTPNILHFDTIMKAIKAGKHVYCEKPMCISYNEAQTAEKAAKESGLSCGMVFHNRFLAPMLRAKQLIDDGRIGRILSFRADYYHSSASDTAKRAGWKQNRDICGGGVLFDLGSHILDLVHHLCGDFENVTALSQIAYPVRMGMDGGDWHTNADEAFYILCELASGGIGTVTASKVHTGTNDDVNIEIYGEKGALRYSLMEPEWLYFYDTSKQDTPIGGERGFTRIECVGRFPSPGGVFPSPKAPVGWLMGHVTNYMNFLTAVYERKEPSPSFSDGAYVQKLMEAAYFSAEKRRTVRVDDFSFVEGKS